MISSLVFITGLLIGYIIGKITIETFDKWIVKKLMKENASDVTIIVDDMFIKYERLSTGKIQASGGEIVEKNMEEVSNGTN